MKKAFLSICIVLSFTCCNSTDYESLIKKSNSYKWYNNKKDAETALKYTDKAINKEPNIWNAYSLEINIYSVWVHFPPDFSDNFEGIKSVYDRWLSNGNKLNTLQKLGYANTLYCLDDTLNANQFYSEIINYYNDNQIDFSENERDYFIYIFAHLMLYDVDENYFNKIKFSVYDDNKINDYLLDEINAIKESGKKQLAERYCTS